MADFFDRDSLQPAGEWPSFFDRDSMTDSADTADSTSSDFEQQYLRDMESYRQAREALVERMYHGDQEPKKIESLRERAASGEISPSDYYAITGRIFSGGTGDTAIRDARGNITGYAPRGGGSTALGGPSDTAGLDRFHDMNPDAAIRDYNFTNAGNRALTPPSSVFGSAVSSAGAGGNVPSSVFVPQSGLGIGTAAPSTSFGAINLPATRGFTAEKFQPSVIAKTPVGASSDLQRAYAGLRSTMPTAVATAQAGNRYAQASTFPWRVGTQGRA
jgi:hypothetical protein